MLVLYKKHGEDMLKGLSGNGMTYVRVVIVPWAEAPRAPLPGRPQLPERQHREADMAVTIIPLALSESSSLFMYWPRDSISCKSLSSFASSSGSRISICARRATAGQTERTVSGVLSDSAGFWLVLVYAQQVELDIGSHFGQSAGWVR